MFKQIPMYFQWHISIVAFLMCWSTSISAQDTLSATKLFLIRHAETLADGSEDPFLSKRGQYRAQHWADVLEYEDIEAVYSTDTRRTKSTALPIAEKYGLTIQLYNPFSIQMNEFLAEVAGKNIVVVGHSNTTPAFVNTLINEERFEQLDHGAFGHLFVVTITADGRRSVTHMMIE